MVAVVDYKLKMLNTWIANEKVGKIEKFHTHNYMQIESYVHLSSYKNRKGTNHSTIYLLNKISTIQLIPILKCITATKMEAKKANHISTTHRTAYTFPSILTSLPYTQGNPSPSDMFQALPLLTLYPCSVLPSWLGFGTLWRTNHPTIHPEHPQKSYHPGRIINVKPLKVKLSTKPSIPWC